MVSLNDFLAGEAKRLGYGQPAFDGSTVRKLTLVDNDNPRAQRWVSSKIDAQVEELAAMGPDSGRNHALNAIAYSLGRLAPRWVDPGEIADQLLVACMTNGLVAEDGRKQCEATIKSGLNKGMLDPRDPPIDADDNTTDEWLRSLPETKPLAAAPETSEQEVQYDPATGEVIEAVEIERTSWWPRDLGPILDGEIVEEAPPEFLARSDGHRLFYAGKVNALIGESESGKTWIGLLAVTQALQVGQRVLYLDFEDTAPGIVARLRLMGCTDKQLRKLSYIGPDQSLDVVGRRDLADHLTEHPPALILFDGVNAAMTLLGLDLEKNKDATTFSLTLLRPLKKTGAAVVTIDHVTKSKDNRGSYAIGAQAKRADIDGCALLVEVIQPFGKGMHGKLKLTVSKDRPGQVRAVSAGAKAAGTAHIDSTAGDSTSCWIDAPDLRPDGERPPWRPTVLMQRVSEFLGAVPADSEGVSQSAVETAVTGNVTHVRKALSLLVEDGYVELHVTAKGHKLHRFVQPYVAPDETPRPPVHTPSSPRPGRGSDTPSTRPPPYGGTGTGSDKAANNDHDDNEGWWQK